MPPAARKEFELWTPGAHIGEDLKVKSTGSLLARYYVLEDLKPSQTRDLFKTDYTTGAQIFLLEGIDDGKSYVAKVVYDNWKGSEVRNQLDIARLAHRRLPNIIRTFKTGVTKDDAYMCRVVLMESAYQFRPHYMKIRKALSTPAETNEFHLSLAFQLLYAMTFLHFNCYQHRDIRDANIVFEVETGPSEVKSHLFRLDAAHMFEIPLRFGTFWAVPKLIDFGLTANMLVEDEQSQLTAYVSTSRPPDFIFSDGTRRLDIRNSDELFALGMTLFYFLYEPFKLDALEGPHFDKLCALIEKLQEDQLYELYFPYPAKEIANHAISLVLLMGFPDYSYRQFYTSPVGAYLVDIEYDIQKHRHYNLLSRSKTDNYCGRHPEMMKLIRKLVRWERFRRPVSAAELLKSTLFDRFKTTTNETPHWNVMFGNE
jgi:serine/threonine protein kinase